MHAHADSLFFGVDEQKLVILFKFKSLLYRFLATWSWLMYLPF